MARNKTAKNLLGSRDAYNRYYGDFRGIDFSSDHTLVDERRLAYAVNMYKDYNSGGGKALETIPGFRKRAKTRLSKRINGIHEYQYRAEAREKTQEFTLGEPTRWKYTEEVSKDTKLPGIAIQDVSVEYAKYFVSGFDIYVEFKGSHVDDAGVFYGTITTEYTGSAPGTEIDIFFDVAGEQRRLKVTLKNKSMYKYRVDIPQDMKIYKAISLKAENNENIPLISDYEYKFFETELNRSAKGEKVYLDYKEQQYETRKKVFVHSGNDISEWISFPENTGTPITEAITVPAPTGDAAGTPIYTIYPDKQSSAGDPIKKVTTVDGTDITINAEYNPQFLLISDSEIVEGDYVILNYIDIFGDEFTENVGLEEHNQDENTWRLTRTYRYVFRVKKATLCKVSGTEVFETIDVTNAVTVWRDSVTIASSALREGDTVYIEYIPYPAISMSNHVYYPGNIKSTSFVLNGNFYILAEGFFQYFNSPDKAQHFLDAVDNNAYIPTRYINTVPSGVNADIGTEYEQRNLLSDYYRQTFIADGETKEYALSEPARSIYEIRIYGNPTKEYTYDDVNGVITFNEAPAKPEDAGFPEGHAGVEVTAVAPHGKNFAGTGRSAKDLINGCTVAAIYDGRVFLAGNANAPHIIFYCERNSDGVADPSYFGALNYMIDGTSHARITAMIPLTGTLAVLKEKSLQDGTVFYHTPMETGNNIQPKVYPSTQGLAGTGCLGPAVNFLDDPIFLSRGGVEAIGQLSVRYERAIEHRSSMIDAKLAGLDLSTAELCEWNGYLCLLCEGKIFLADSRQRYTDEYGNAQYEWYYLEDIGAFEGQYTEYMYSLHIPEGLQGKTVKYCEKCRKGERECTCDTESFIELELMVAEAVYNAELDETLDLRGKAANPPDENGEETGEIFFTTMKYVGEFDEYPIDIAYSVHDVRDRATLEHVRYEAYRCETKGQQTGGTYYPATTMREIDGTLYFGTENGEVFCFNTDKRDENGDIPPEWYTFDGRTIYAGCATKMDNCGIPHLTKSTVKRSTVIKTKSFSDSAAKIKVRTNKNAYKQIARINNKRFVFDNVDFSDFSFATSDQSLFSIQEKEKKWVEKQYYIYTDEYKKPFALYYCCYRYTVAGRYKE